MKNEYDNGKFTDTPQFTFVTPEEYKSMLVTDTPKRKEIILAKIGEIALKGLNRKNFEDLLIKNIKKKIHKLGRFEVVSSQSTIRITPLDDSVDMDEVSERVSKVFGIVTFSRACVTEKDIEDIKAAAVEYLKPIFSKNISFKVIPMSP